MTGSFYMTSTFWYLVCCYLSIGTTDAADDFQFGCPFALSSHFPNGITSVAIRETYDNALKERKHKIATFKPGEDELDLTSLRHQFNLREDKQTRRLTEKQRSIEETTRILQKEYQLSRKQTTKKLPGIYLRHILPDAEHECNISLTYAPCDPEERYRRMDGTCNNLENPLWGSTGVCHRRFLHQDYEDGISTKRTGVNGDLPNPRAVSVEIHSDLNKPSIIHSHMFQAFGQFLTHDVTLTPLLSGPNGERVNCCPPSGANPLICDPILVSEEDHFYSKFNVTCLNNLRSALCPTCKLGPREQINQLTSYIDGSVVYGESLNKSHSLRTLDGTGFLKTQHVHEVGELPPPSFNPDKDGCSFQRPDLGCFQAGENRANIVPSLTSLHVLFLREHNRVCRILKKMNHKWGEEKIFQEARRILGAELQVIVYKEYLPLVLGPFYMKQYGLNIRSSGYTQYRETIDATTYNEFVAAAFRFGHSTIARYFPEIFNRHYSLGNRVKDTFFFPFDLYMKGRLEGFLRGLNQFPAQQVDRHIVKDVTQHLYQLRGDVKGLDLASLNINRGRGHGIPGYVHFVQFCTGVRISTFRQLRRLMPSTTVRKLQELYRDVEDVDLFTGGLAERPVRSGVIGPTFTCLIARQFRNLKYGDRFYFEHDTNPHPFTPDQLRAIKKASLARVICDNTNTESTAVYAMRRIHDNRGIRKCENIPFIDLSPWKE